MKDIEDMPFLITSIMKLTTLIFMLMEMILIPFIEIILIQLDTITPKTPHSTIE